MKKAFNLKKALLCVLVLVLCVATFVACNDDQYDSTGLEEARNYIKQMYRSDASETASDYKVTTSSIDNSGNKYTVEWTVVVTEGDANGVKVVANGDGTATIDVDSYATETIKYTLTATIKDGDHSLTLEYNRTVPKFVVSTWEEYKAGCEAKDTDKSYAIKGYVIGVNAAPLSSSKGSLWIMDKDGHGYYAYKPTLDSAVTETRESINAEFPFGTEVVVRGTLTVYSGAYEFNSGCTVEKTGNTATGDGVSLDFVDRTDVFAAATSNTDDALIPYQSTLAELKGVTLRNIDADGKKYYFSLDGKDFVLYNDIYCLDDAQVEELAAKWVVGAKANIKGFVNTYSKVYQIYPLGTDAISIQEQTDEEKVAGVKGGLPETGKYTTNFTLPTSSLVTLTWELKSGTGAVLGEDGYSVTVTQSKTAAQTVVFEATLTSGDVTDTMTYTVTIPMMAETFITQALTAANALEDGSKTTDSYILIGTVKEITEAYNAEYGNVSFTLTDGVEDVLVYRYNLDDASTIAVGSSVAITAPMKKYGTTLEAVGTFAKFDVVTLKAAAEAGLAGNATESTVYGYVKTINTVYSSSWDNISITITDGTNDLYCYRLKGGSDIKEGDYLLVTGVPTNYNNSAQMPSGATYTKSAVATDPDQKAIDALVVPTSVDADFTLSDTATWTVKTGVDNITIDGTAAKITRSDSEDVTVTITATIGTKSKDFDVKVLKNGTVANDGTAEHPYTVAEIKAATANLAKSEYTSSELYVKGIISSCKQGSYLQNIYLVDEADLDVSFLVFSCNFANDVTKAYINDTVVIKGAVQNYNGTIEMTRVKNGDDVVFGFPTFISRTAGTSTVSVDNTSSEKATVSIDNNVQSGTNDETFTFTVTVESGYEIVSVKVNDTEVTIAEGKYTGTIAGPTTILVETKAEGSTEQKATISYTGGTTNMTGSNQAALFGLDETIFTVIGTKTGGNNNVGLNQDGTIRFYNNSGCTLTISVASGYKIISVKVTGESSKSGTLVVKSGDTTLTGTDGVYTVNGSTISMLNDSTTKSAQYWISSIEIVYDVVAE